MKVCVFGAGAIGGYVAAKLAASGNAEVSCVARGPHLAAMKANGLTLRSEGQTLVTHPRCTDDARELGPQDYVLIAVKAHSLPAAAPSIRHLLGERTALVPAINGVPWWYFYKSGGPWENARVQSVDPGARLWELLPPSRVIGCIVYPATEVVAPGVIEHTYSNRFDLVIGNPETRALARTLMVEAQGVAEKLGVELPLDVDAHIAGAAEVGSHKPSTLIDLERGRPMEIDALLGAVVEMARMTSVPTPQCESVLALVRQLGRSTGTYAEPVPAPR